MAFHTHHIGMSIILALLFMNKCLTDVNLNVICKQMGRSPDWMPDILLRADGYENSFYKKD